jgi:serine/threonine protein phosphatase PrpC
MLSVQLSLLPGEAPASLQVQLYGVYDGHGTDFGDVVSAYIAQNLHKHFEQHLSGGQRSSSVDAAHAADAGMQAALIYAFEQTDRDLMQNPVHSSASTGAAGLSGLLCSSSAGSTATVAAVTDTAVYLAWAGK